MTLKKNDYPPYAFNTQSEQNAVSIKLMQQEFTYMKTAIEELKASIDEGFIDVKSNIVELKREIKDVYATKEQLNTIKDDVEELNEIKSNSVKFIVFTAITSLLGVVSWLIQSRIS